MSVIVPVLCDEDVDKYINDASYNLYFREGSSGSFEISDGFSAEDIKDATVHGFEFVAYNGPCKSVLSDPKYDNTSVYDDRDKEMER